MGNPCRYRNRSNKAIFPCSDCKYKGSCETAGGKEPLTCEHCKFYCGIGRVVCENRNGYNLRPCENFQWN